MKKSQVDALAWMVSQRDELRRRTEAVMALLNQADAGEEIDLRVFEQRRADLSALVDQMNREARSMAWPR